jgi:hypothetical protein
VADDLDGVLVVGVLGIALEFQGALFSLFVPSGRKFRAYFACGLRAEFYLLLLDPG